MKTVLFLHGFFSSGSCELADTLKESLRGKATLLSPDLPKHPLEALDIIMRICDRENIDLMVGNSCGSFYAQILAPIAGIPALLGNPHFRMTEFLTDRKGNHKYKSKRLDGNQSLVIDNELIEEFAEVEKIQFRYFSPYYREKIWGIFGENDPVAHCEGEFLNHYINTFHFPGAHTPTADEVRIWYIPLIEKMLTTFNRPKERYFRHFKGGTYRLIQTAYNSEKPKERIVIYESLYGDHTIWARPETMFFENIKESIPRFIEISDI